MRDLPKVGQVWKHFKENTLAFIENIAIHTDTLTKGIVYTCIKYDIDEEGSVIIRHKETYYRPADEFMSEVNKEKYPDVIQDYRFVLIPEDQLPFQKIKVSNKDIL